MSENNNNVEAVSYTHLDVYKRQLKYKVNGYKILSPLHDA